MKQTHISRYFNKSLVVERNAPAPARLLRNRLLEEYTKSNAKYFNWPLQRSVTKDIYFMHKVKIMLISIPYLQIKA